MAILIVLGAALLFLLIFGPQYWVRKVMRDHAVDRPDYPGTGAELARHLLDEAGLAAVKVEKVSGGDHYSPSEKVVRLSAENHDGKSITAVAVAAHEVAHAVQDRDGYRPLQWRQKLVAFALAMNKAGSMVFMAVPIVLIFVRSPPLVALNLAVGFAMVATSLVVHAVTLPTELDASFKRALPALTHYLPASDMAAARKVLKAAAITYVAAALANLLDVMRWIRVFR